MKRWIIAALVLALSMLITHHNPKSNEEHAVQVGSTEGIPNKYAAETLVSLRLESRSQEGDYHTLNMRWLNPTRRSLTFTGYSESSPLYKIEKWVDGSWEQHNVGWFCGTGLRECVIPGGRSSVILVHVQDNLFPIRVGVGFEHGGKEQTVWSTRIDRIPLE